MRLIHFFVERMPCTFTKNGETVSLREIYDLVDAEYKVEHERECVKGILENTCIAGKTMEFLRDTCSGLQLKQFVQKLMDNGYEMGVVSLNGHVFLGSVNMGLIM